jgi:hypothetical protein
MVGEDTDHRKQNTDHGKQRCPFFGSLARVIVSSPTVFNCFKGKKRLLFKATSLSQFLRELFSFFYQLKGYFITTLHKLCNVNTRMIIISQLNSAVSGNISSLFHYPAGNVRYG